MLHRQEIDHYLKPGRPGPVPINGGDVGQHFEPGFMCRGPKLQQLLSRKPHNLLPVRRYFSSPSAAISEFDPLQLTTSPHTTQDSFPLPSEP